MNKRKKKKFERKNRCRTYYGYRQAEIFRRVSNYIDLKSNDIVYIVDSRRMDLKHFQKVSVLKNCYPIGMGLDNGDELEHDSTTLEFTCTKYQNTDIDRVAELLKSVMNSHSTDLMDIRNGKYLDENNQPIPEFFDMVHDYEKRLDYAKNNTSLPDNPNYKKINEFVYSVNERIVKGEL